MYQCKNAFINHLFFLCDKVMLPIFSYKNKANQLKNIVPNPQP